MINTEVLGYIVSAVGGCGLLEAVKFFVGRKQEKAKAEAEASLMEAEADGKVSDNALTFAARMEERLARLDERCDALDARVNLFQRAINCAYRCKNIDDPEVDCPVLIYLASDGIKGNKDI